VNWLILLVLPRTRPVTVTPRVTGIRKM